MKEPGQSARSNLAGLPDLDLSEHQTPDVNHQAEIPDDRHRE
jgi:hypothetical protein